uniref:ZP domain-containing protein n=1 Tax=Latimeria chalumnae TaxID=7897 RepID=H3AJ97_LATCH
ENSDIDVTCGTESMALSILLCPVYFAGYNESLISLNGQFNNLLCHGLADWKADPPVINFNFSIHDNAVTSCKNNLQIFDHQGSGVFSQFSNVQSLNISGTIQSLDPTTGTITYKQELIYLFSCSYPLQYFINNTELSVAGVSIAIKDNNGTFVSTLSMYLFEDRHYQNKLVIPSSGLKLKKRVYVEVMAKNLTDKFYVLLDRCYATTESRPSNSTSYDLFVGCNKDPQTVVHTNGEDQHARFSFEAFRFVEHKDRIVSTYYLHCMTRLCDREKCATIRPNCNSRRKREVAVTIPSVTASADFTESAIVSSPQISAEVDAGKQISFLTTSVS